MVMFGVAIEEMGWDVTLLGVVPRLLGAVPRLLGVVPRLLGAVPMLLATFPPKETEERKSSKSSADRVSLEAGIVPTSSSRLIRLVLSRSTRAENVE